MTDGHEWTLAMQQELEGLRADHERAERYEAGLRGEIQQLQETLQAWQQRFGDAQATLSRQAAVVEAARTCGWNVEGCACDCHPALDAVPQRAASPEASC